MPNILDEIAAVTRLDLEEVRQHTASGEVPPLPRGVPAVQMIEIGEILSIKTAEGEALSFLVTDKMLKEDAGTLALVYSYTSILKQPSLGVLLGCLA